MEHADPVSLLFERAQQSRIPMSEICREAGVAATTPSRWKNNRNGTNLDTVKKLNEALGRILTRSESAAA